MAVKEEDVALRDTMHPYHIDDKKLWPSIEATDIIFIQQVLFDKIFIPLIGFTRILFEAAK